MILREAPREHYPWIAQRADLNIGPGFRAMEAIDGERILGMVAFDGWQVNSCCMHVALEAPIAARRLLYPAFRYAFVLEGKGVVVGAVLSTNEKAIALNRHLGFSEVARGRDWCARGVDLVWMEMRRENCRWIQQAERKAA
jgi:hypothetical protein